MRRRLAEYRLFFKESLRNFQTTGAILPSGRVLASALARFVGDCPLVGQVPCPTNGKAGPRRILEVGPGTGAVTRRILAALRPHDLLDLVELNQHFVEQLRDRFKTDRAFLPAAGRTRVWHCPIEELPQEHRYDLIISGLPLNNFSVANVEQILAGLTGLLKPGGILSFFEYIAVRRVRALVSGPVERARLRGIGEAMRSVLSGHEIRRDWIWPNVPPAWVHHVRK